MELHGARLAQRNALSIVDRLELEGDVVLFHQADPDPDVGRYPVPLPVGSDDEHLVLARQPAAQSERGGVSGNAGAENDLRGP